MNQGFIVTRHSQSTENAKCPTGMTELWKGYSFVSSTDTAQQDLGTSGSCLQQFMISPTIRCNGDNCQLGMNKEKSYWLTTDKKSRSSFSQSDIKKFVSRCVVCESPTKPIVFHTNSICPSGWSTIWTGQSLASNKGGLSSTGSCMNKQDEMTVECSSETGSCVKIQSREGWLTDAKKKTASCKVCLQY